MAFNYPIWHNIEACHYKTDKSFGGRNTSVDKIVVGSSSKNSHTFVETITTRRFYNHDKYGDVCVFKYSVDGIILKEFIFEDNNGKAGKFIKERNILKRMKGIEND